MKCRFLKLAGISTVVVLAFAAIMPASGFSAEGSFDRTLKVTGPVEMEVTTDSGTIDVRTGDSGSVHVVGRIRVSGGWHMDSAEADRKVHELETNPPIEQDGNFIRLGKIEDEELRRNVSISFEIQTPAETRLNARTGSGNETIEGVRGPLRAGTGSGSIRVSNIGDEVDAESGSGDIELNAVKGRARIRTGSGRIRGSGIAGGINAATGSGNIRLEQTAPGDVRIETGSGGAEVSGVNGALDARAGSGSITATGIPTGEWRLQSGSGTLSVKLTSEVGFDLDAHTNSGHINTSLPVTVQGTVGRGRMEGKARGGGVRLSLETGSGNINID